MKKIYAFLMMAAAMVACTQMEQPQIVEEPEVQTYTLSVEATKGEDPTEDDASKALTLTGKTLSAAWAVGEAVTVYNKTTNELLGGSLTAQEASNIIMAPFSKWMTPAPRSSVSNRLSGQGVPCHLETPFVW